VVPLYQIQTRLHGSYYGIIDYPSRTTLDELGCCCVGPSELGSVSCQHFSDVLVAFAIGYARDSVNAMTDRS
jgi:hypothetical protein